VAQICPPPGHMPGGFFVRDQRSALMIVPLSCKTIVASGTTLSGSLTATVRNDSRISTGVPVTSTPHGWRGGLRLVACTSTESSPAVPAGRWNADVTPYLLPKFNPGGETS